MRERLIEILTAMNLQINDSVIYASIIERTTDKILALLHETKSENTEEMTASEMIDKKLIIRDGKFKGATVTLSRDAIIELMESYAKTKQIDLRKELIKYSNWTRKGAFPAESGFIESVVDAYLNNK